MDGRAMTYADGTPEFRRVASDLVAPELQARSSSATNAYRHSTASRHPSWLASS